MTRPQAKIVKPDLHRHLERARARHGFAPGDRVEYPSPHPPVAVRTHEEVEDEHGEVVPGDLVAEPFEVARPVGHEEWFGGTVIEIQHFRRAVEPDGYVAIVEPDEGPGAFPISVLLIRRPSNRGGST